MRIVLSLSSLEDIPRSVGRPGCRRDQLGPGIVDIGIGNFHRAHQAVYLDDLVNTGRGPDRAIAGAGMRQFDIATCERLAGQDWLTAVVETDDEKSRARITGGMIGYPRIGTDGTAIVNQCLGR